MRLHKAARGWVQEEPVPMVEVTPLYVPEAVPSLLRITYTSRKRTRETDDHAKDIMRACG